jgi:2-oxoglutarate ferredoxin oxidoreductase subunit delta
VAEKKAKGPKGIVNIISERCKGCGFCIEFCPIKILKFSEVFNSKGYHPPFVVEPQKCTGCKLCEMLCPDFSIFVVPVKQEAAT